MIKKEEYIASCEQELLHVYNRFPVVFEKGRGVRLYDTDGKEYLDFGAGIAVFALGYGNEAYNDALKDQIDLLIHTSNLFYHPQLAGAARKIIEHTGLKKVFFTNSGAEAIEGALKAAKKYAFLRDGYADHEIIAMKHSFHGRTVGALSVTGNEHYRDPFLPLMGGVRFADFNSFESILAQVTEKTCAILLECVQGEGGIIPADPAFLKQVRSLCDERDILLIFDEIQCGMGRCGSWFAYQDYDVVPDICTTAKALGCGIPVGAFVLGEKCADKSLQPGDHGTTYGGNPLALAAGREVFRQFEENDIIGHVRELTGYLETTLDRLVDRFHCLKGRRGKGFMQGLIIEGIKPGTVVSRALENGLVVLSAGSDVIRLVPPLVIEKEDIDEMAATLEKVLSKLE